MEIYELTVSRSRRMLRTLYGPDPLRRREHAGPEMFRIEEVLITSLILVGDTSACRVPCVRQRASEALFCAAWARCIAGTHAK